MGLNSLDGMRLTTGKRFMSTLTSLTSTSTSHLNLTHNKVNLIMGIKEYPLIILFVITGAIFLISTNDLVSIFLSIELQSYGLYILSTIYRNSELSTTGGLIYFLLGAVKLGRSQLCPELSNSGEALKFLILTRILHLAVINRLYNPSCKGKVIIQKMKQTKIGNRGSKCFGWAKLKEQRVNGSYATSACLCVRPALRYTLKDFERNYQFRTLSILAFAIQSRAKDQIILQRFSTSSVSMEKQNLFFTSGTIHPMWLTGFADGFLKKRGIRLYRTKRSCTNHQLSLVIWGTNLRSQVGTERLTKQESNMIKLPLYQKSVIIGLLLSDGWLTIASKTHKNARLGFAQSADHSKYFYYVFFQLSHYCSSFPIVRIRTLIRKK